MLQSSILFRRTFSDYDTVLLAYGSMHEQKSRKRRSRLLLDELQVNFVSATAILTLFAAELGTASHRAVLPRSLPSPEIADAGRTTSYGSAKGSARAYFFRACAAALHPAGVARHHH
jgi:hypothetical protein